MQQKIKLLFVVIYGLCPIITQAKSVEDILQLISKSSLKIEERENLFFSNIGTLDSQDSVFSPSAYFRTSFSEIKTVPTSPFSATQTRQTQYEVGASKLWTSGITSSISYLYNDQATYYDTRDDFFVKSPTLELSFTTSILQDLVGGRYKAFKSYLDFSKDSEKLSSKIDKKLILATSLIDMTTIMQVEETLSLQKAICKETKTQIKQLEIKIKRKSISKRNFLLGQKELSNCLASIESYQQELDTLKIQFYAKYNLHFGDLGNIDLEKIFDQAKDLYNKVKNNKMLVRKNLSDEVNLSETLLKALKEKRNELKALNRTNIALELRTGLAGVGSNIQDANEELTNQNYPYVYVGMQIDFPFSGRASAQNYIANEYAIRATENSKKQLTIEKEEQFSLLKRTLETHFVIYKRYRKNLYLSKEVVKEANLDFKNGRLDFNDLLDFNKTSLEDQRVLANHRLNLLVDLIAYLDFYQFFDSFVTVVQ